MEQLLANKICYRWTGDVAKLDDEKLPKTILFFSQLEHDHRRKASEVTTEQNIDHKTWYKTAHDRIT